MSKRQPLRIGVCGNGTVGGGTIDILRRQASLLAARAGRELVLTRVGARRDREDCSLDGIAVHRDLMDVATADDVDVLVECIGGTDVAQELVAAALDSGKSVVTANKALIAEHGNTLVERAEARGVFLCFEAAVAGCIPVIKALREGMAANYINSVSGIINGTGNYILTEMGEGGRAFDDVLAEAQRLGYAEADPTFDVEGIDAAHKLAILSALAFGTPLNFPAVQCEGIAGVTPDDIRYAGELGYRIKHLGISKRCGDAVEMRVHPTLLRSESLLARVDGVLNAVCIDADAAGQTVYSGAGAGRLPTASAVVADLVDIARHEGPAPSPLGIAGDYRVALPVVAADAVCCPWYLRLTAQDRPGVMSQLSNCLGAQGISIEALIQKKPKPGIREVPIVVLTDPAREGALRKAVDAITRMESVSEAPHCIRCEEQE